MAATMSDGHGASLCIPGSSQSQVSEESLIAGDVQTTVVPGTVSNTQGDGLTAENGNGTYRDVDLSAIPMLPDYLHLSYVAEGAANIIYRLSVPSDLSEAGGLPPHVGDTHLLRLRKALPSGSPNLPAFAALQRTFFPLFPKEFTLDTRIIRIPEGLIEKENAILKEREASGGRPPKRAGLYLVGPPPPPGTPVDQNGEKSTLYERYGFLVEDMTPSAPGKKTTDGRYLREVLVEFKPKWLVPSPSAPAGARRCRTCALRILKETTKTGIKIAGNGSGNPGHWCPYDLASGDAHRVRLAVRGMLAQKGAILTGWKKADGSKGEINGYESMILEDKVVGYFLGSRGKKLLNLLKKYQTEWDQQGAEAVFGEKGDKNTEPAAVPEGHDGEWGDEWSEVVKKYLMAMTVRDSTLFLKVNLSTPPLSDPNATDESVQCRIGDLDLKSPENGKAKYWVGVERILRNGGWYAGTEHVGRTNGHDWPPVTRKGSNVGDKRKHGEVGGEIVDGRRISATGEAREVTVERERDEEGSEGGMVGWCTF